MRRKDTEWAPGFRAQGLGQFSWEKRHSPPLPIGAGGAVSPWAADLEGDTWSGGG